MRVWVLCFIFTHLSGWKSCFSSIDVEILSAYVGYVFNASIIMDEKVILPKWIHWNNETLIGLPLELNLGEKLLLSSVNGNEYIINVENPNPWWSKLTKLKESDFHTFEPQMFLAAFAFDQDSFLALSIVDKIKFVTEIMNLMGISQPIIVLPYQSVHKSITFVTKSATNSSSNKSFVLLWSIGKDFIFNSSLKSLQQFENWFSHGPVYINHILIQQWFVGFLRHQRKLSKIYYRRSINNPELVALIEGSGSWQNKKANEFIKRSKDITNDTEPFLFNSSLSRFKPSVLIPLLPIKMHALQIMNFVIPENTFIDKEFKSSLKVKVFFHDDRQVGNDPTKWISYNQNDQNIRINPKLTDIGETILKICAYNINGGFICQNLSVSVSSPPPQNHQIYVSKSHKDYIIKYTIPLAWFKRFGVKKREDFPIINATGNSPFDWNKNGQLEILDVASIEGKLIEINLLTLIKNESKIYIHLTLPVVAINRQKLATGPLYRSVFMFREENQIEKKIIFSLADTWKLLKEMENYIDKSFGFYQIKIQIFSPIRSPVFFDKKQGNKENLLIFDWFFYGNNSIPSFCNNFKIDTMEQELLSRSFGYFFMVNITVLENRFGGICNFKTEINPITKESVEYPELINTTPSLSDLKIAAESEIINKTFPNFQFTPFTVSAGVPFRSYIFRTASFDPNNIKEMRLEAFSGIESEPWIALSASNDFLYGLPLKKHVRESAYKFRFIIKLVSSQTQFKVTFQVSVVDFDHNSVSLNHKVKLSIKTENTKIDVQYHWKLVTKLDMYVRDNCEVVKDCGKDIALWDVDSIQAAENPSSASVSIEISFLSLISQSSNYCPKLSLIRLYEKFINTAMNNKETIPNLSLKQLFSTYGLGEIIGCQIILIGTCHGIKLQPPDLGQITVYSMIPFYQSLQKFKAFYNSSVWFTINSDNVIKEKALYHEWISVNEDSTALVGLALHKHCKQNPYLVELVVHSNTVRQILSQKIAVRVRQLKEHQFFFPFLQQPNHQIIISTHTKTKLTQNKILLFKFLFSSKIDQYFRPNCIKSNFIDSGFPISPCGSNIIYEKISNSENVEVITFKFSLINELTYIKLIDSTPYPVKKSSDDPCPMDRLAKIERSLVGDHGSPKLGILPIVNDYFHKSNIGNIVDIKFEYLGACYQLKHQRNSKIELLDEENRKISSSIYKKVNDDSRQMFLMATIVPTCSFIIISLCVGLMVACCLQKRNQKFLRSMNSHLSSTEFAMRGGTSPIILAGEYQHSYIPPSRPLILPHEKPPVSPPDYITENNSVLIHDEDA